MLQTLANWLVSALLILVIAYVLPGVGVEGFFIALVVALVLGLISAIIKPVVLFLTLPLNMITLGLFTFVVDALMVMLAAAVVPGFNIANFWWALAFAVVLTIVNVFFKGRTTRPLGA